MRVETGKRRVVGEEARERERDQRVGSNTHLKSEICSEVLLAMSTATTKP